MIGIVMKYKMILWYLYSGNHISNFDNEKIKHNVICDHKPRFFVNKQENNDTMVCI